MTQRNNPSHHQGNLMASTRRTFLKSAPLVLAAAGLLSMPAFAADTIKVGVLHPVRHHGHFGNLAQGHGADAIDEINAKGGVLGKKLEPVVVDPASNWPLFAEKARQLLSKDKVAVTFGCWTSVSRKSVLPVYEELNGLLFYPVQYEGEEMSPTCSTPGLRPTSRPFRRWNT
jgi:urea transport system substrate-binding protein